MRWLNIYLHKIIYTIQKYTGVKRKKHYHVAKQKD